ncbi:MAG: sulfotransferase [Rudaea sp.]|uniref:sulfotransferase family protein n=1 Tax=Rudaea sp. TaxID=2136325 RepID=UPI0039E70A07
MPADAPAPVFIVGSPRSGTSILTWCLGQHSNLLPLEESTWMGDFAADAGARHWLGSSWGDNTQFKVLGVTRDAFLAEIGIAIDRILRRHAAAFEFDEMPEGAGIDEVFRLRRSMRDPKRRWVDGTPEYSLQICALRKLFPAAKFVHIVRRCDDVVASMLNFHRISHYELAPDPAKAYVYWFDRVSACLLAEEALGKDVVHRLRHADLIERPQAALAGILEFLGEPFEPACLQPLAKRINSSQVPVDFHIDKSAVDAELLQRVADLDAAMQRPLPPLPSSDAALRRFEASFEARVRDMAELGGEHARAQKIVDDLHDECAERTRWARHLDSVLSGFGAYLVLQFLVLVCAAILVAAHPPRAGLVLVLPLLTSFAGACAYLWMRRANWNHWLRGIVGKTKLPQPDASDRGAKCG